MGCAATVHVEPPQGGKGMLDKTPADSGSRERALSWLLQLDEVMVFVAKLITFLVVCGICCCCGSPPLSGDKSEVGVV